MAYQVTQILSFGGLGRGFPPVRVGALLTHAFGSWVFGIPSHGGNEKVLLGSRHAYSHVCSIVRLTTNSRPNRILLLKIVKYRTGHSELVDIAVSVLVNVLVSYSFDDLFIYLLLSLSYPHPLSGAWSISTVD